MEFKNFGDLVNQINSSLGEFCNEFGKMRKELAHLGKAPKRGILFTYDSTKANNWAINEGGGTELQYHIAFDPDEMEIKYGLGFNTQYVPFANKKSPVEYMKPFIYGYLKHEIKIKKLLPDYNFVIGNIHQLKKPEEDQYTLLGKIVSVEKRKESYFIEDPIFKSITDDLKKQFEPYQIIFKENDNFNKKSMGIQTSIDILMSKGQIILQGPPGTGKTREAKIIGRELVLPNEITVEDIQKTIYTGLTLKSSTEYSEYEISKIDNQKVSVKLVSGNEYSPSFKEIIVAYKSKLWLNGQKNGNDPYSAAIAKYIFDNLDCNEQIKLIQFHPAFSYEDFVRGIVAESKGTQIDYVTKDKVLAKFAKDAYLNWKASTEPKEKVAKEIWVQETLEDFRDFLSEEIEDKEEKLMITGKAYINRITENSIRYNSDAWEVDGGVPNSDIIKMYLANTTTRRQIKDNTELTKTAKSLSTYWLEILKLFKKYISDNNLKPIETQNAVAEKKYVLIIDEINRANLPAVLGELIYALEYRGEKVESLYPIDDDNTLIIPPNLYIIGTMNTSDRSVGHIDYAIRRRFAFVNILPKVLEGDNFELDLFKQVSKLFIQNLDEYIQDNTVELKLSEHLSEEFRPEDVWLGHSYFIKNESDFEIRKKYEIIPILKEYLKDGILKQSAEPIINAL